MSDSSDIDAAIVAVLANDATLTGLLPDGVYIDRAPPGSRNFAIVSLFYESDESVMPGRRLAEDAVYVVKAVSYGSNGSTAKAAAARIDALLENAVLVVPGYECMTVHREERIRRKEADDIDPSIEWQHRGGQYRVAMALV